MPVSEVAEKPSSPTLRSILTDRSVASVIGLAFVIMFGTGLVLPILPLFARSFGVSFAGAATLLSAYGLTRLALDLFAGPLVDRIGERLAGTSGLILIAGASTATALAPTFVLAIISWALVGAGSSILMAANYSYLLKVAPKNAMGRTLGVFYGSFNAGILAGGFGGGFLADRFGLASPLVLYGVLSFAAALLYRVLLVDPAQIEADASASRTTSLSRLRMLFKRSAFVTALMLNFAYMWFVTAGFDTFVPLFAKTVLDMTPAGIGVAYACLVVTEFAVLYPAGMLSDRIGRKPVLLASFAGLAVLVASLGSVSTPLGLGFVMALLGIASGYAAVGPTSMLSDATAGEKSGTAVGAFRFAGDLAFVLGPVAVGATMDNFSFNAAAVVGGLPLALALVVAARVPETLRREEG